MKYVIISVDLEEWFDSDLFDSPAVQMHNFGCSPATDVEDATKRLLKFFDLNSIRATFFSLLRVFARYPRLVEVMRDSNHELAVHGNHHQSILHLGPRKFEEELRYTKNRLELLTRQKMIGYRAPNFEITTEALTIISKLGFVYDASINPCLRIPGWYGWPSCPLEPFKHEFQSASDMVYRTLIEFPLSVYPIIRFPGCGGWYLRNFGINWVKLLLKLHLKTHDVAVVYIHPWEISNNNPLLPEIPFHVFRRTGNWTLNALNSIIAAFGDKVTFTSFKDYLETEGV